MTPRPETLEREKDKLFLTDAELIRKLGVPERTARARIKHLEAKAGFPLKRKLWGDRRYWPAVKEWLDRTNGLSMGDDADRLIPENRDRTRLPRRSPADAPERRSNPHARPR